MPWLLLVAACYVAAILQATLDPVIGVGYLVPDWFALTALLVVLTVCRPRSLAIGLIVGLAADVSGVGPLGISTAMLLLTTVAVAHVRRKLHIEHPALQVPLLALAATTYTVGVVLVTMIATWSTAAGVASLLGALGVGLYTGAIALPVLLIVSWIREPQPITVLQAVGR